MCILPIKRDRVSSPHVYTVKAERSRLSLTSGQYVHVNCNVKSHQIISDGDESSSEEEEKEEDQEEGASPDEQRLELTPPSEDEHTEAGSSSTSASTREVTRVQSEQAHKYMTRSRAKLLRNKT